MWTKHVLRVTECCDKMAYEFRITMEMATQQPTFDLTHSNGKDFWTIAHCGKREIALAWWMASEL